MEKSNEKGVMSNSAKMLELFSDGKWHSNDELYAISRRPSSIVFVLKEKGFEFEKKRDEVERFKVYFRMKGQVPEWMKIVEGRVRDSRTRESIPETKEKLKVSLVR